MIRRLPMTVDVSIGFGFSKTRYVNVQFRRQKPERTRFSKNRFQAGRRTLVEPNDNLTVGKPYERSCISTVYTVSHVTYYGRLAVVPVKRL